MGTGVRILPLASAKLSSCAHRWVRRPDCDPSVLVLAYRCDACGAHGERRFGTRQEVRVVEPSPGDYWDRGRRRTERDRLRNVFSQLGVDELISGQALTFAEVIRSGVRGARASARTSRRESPRTAHGQREGVPMAIAKNPLRGGGAASS